MTHPQSFEAIVLLEREISAREALDPKFFEDLKKSSIEKATALGIKLETLRSLLAHE